MMKGNPLRNAAIMYYKKKGRLKDSTKSKRNGKGGTVIVGAKDSTLRREYWGCFFFGERR